MIDNTIKYFNQKDLKKLFNTIGKSNNKYALRDLTICRVAYRCGLRVTEIGLIDIENYNKFTGELYCKRLKGSWSNTIRLDKETIKILNKFIKEFNVIEGTLFKSRNNNPISRKTLDLMFKDYCKAAGIKNKDLYHFHTLKHTCAVHLAESGLDIKELQSWLGHKNVNNTLKYFNFTTKQQEEMYKKLEKTNSLV